MKHCQPLLFYFLKDFYANNNLSFSLESEQQQVFLALQDVSKYSC